MKHIIKRILSQVLALSLCLCLCLTACVPSFFSPQPEPAQPPGGQPETRPETQPENNQAEQARFDEFLKRDFIESVTCDAYTLHAKLRAPENYGITEYEVSWGDNLEAAPSEEEIEKDRQTIKEFGTFDRATLTQEQQESYDIYSYQIDLYEKGLELYFYNSAFQGHNGLHFLIPILMSEYQFYTPQDVNDYLTLCSEIGQFFDAQIQFEKLKSEKGLFMSDKLADDVIKSCKEFLSKKEDNILILSFEERLDGIDFEDGSAREMYISRNKEIFYDVVVAAYEKVIAELEGLKGTGSNEMGLAWFERGKEYYIYELERMGITKTPEELIPVFDKIVLDTTVDLYGIISEYPDVLEMLDQPVAPELPVDEIVEYLSDKGADDFPALPQGITYKVKVVDDSLKDFAPGFYLTPQLDYYQDNTIYYDPDQSGQMDQMFFLMAHEGYPGHMMQMTSLLAGELPDYRKVTNFTAYVEGWAHYVEYYCFGYSDEFEPLVRLNRLNREITSALTFRVDLGINYEGWSYEQMAAYVTENTMFDLPAETLESIYFDTVKTPMEIVPYVAGKYEIETMKERYKSLLGEAYSDKLFHEELLKRGAAPYELVWEWMDQALLGQSDPLEEAEQGSRGTAQLF